VSRLRIVTRSEATPCPNVGASVERGVDVLSDGQTSQTYLSSALVDNAEVKALTRMARTSRARSEARRAEFRAEEERKTLEEQVLSTHKRALLLSAQLGRRQAVIEFRTVEFEAAQTGYENNIRTLPEMVDIRLALEEARLAEIRA